MKTVKFIDLKGGLKHTASSAQIKSDGSLVIELHDFSSEAEKWLGNEVAFLLKVSHSDKNKMLSCLLGGQNQMLDESPADDLLLELIGERFTDYYEVKQWIRTTRFHTRRSLIRGLKGPASSAPENANREDICR